MDGWVSDQAHLTLLTYINVASSALRLYFRLDMPLPWHIQQIIVTILLDPTAPNRWGLFVASSLSFIGLERILLTAAMNNHSPSLSRVGGRRAVSDVA